MFGAIYFAAGVVAAMEYHEQLVPIYNTLKKQVFECFEENKKIFRKGE